MQKWEYAELEVTTATSFSGANGDLYIYRANGKHENKKDKPGVLFAQLGEQGWELTTSHALTEKKFIYIFKRPLSE